MTAFMYSLDSLNAAIARTGAGSPGFMCRGVFLVVWTCECLLLLRGRLGLRMGSEV